MGSGDSRSGQPFWGGRHHFLPTLLFSTSKCENMWKDSLSMFRLPIKIFSPFSLALSAWWAREGEQESKRPANQGLEGRVGCLA